MRPGDAAGKKVQPGWGRAGGGAAGWAASRAVFSLALRPGGRCDHPVPPRGPPEPPELGGRECAPGWRLCPCPRARKDRNSRCWRMDRYSRLEDVGRAHPAWVYELLVAMAQAPRSLSALWGHKQELRVHLTLFQLLFLQRVRSAGGGADAEIQSAKICHPRSVGLCRSQEEG